NKAIGDQSGHGEPDHCQRADCDVSSNRNQKRPSMFRGDSQAYSVLVVRLTECSIDCCGQRDISLEVLRARQEDECEGQKALSHTAPERVNMHVSNLQPDAVCSRDSRLSSSGYCRQSQGGDRCWFPQHSRGFTPSDTWQTFRSCESSCARGPILCLSSLSCLPVPKPGTKPAMPLRHTC
ncbi:MAG: hypothetical protein ACI841_002625, partial [Planctomycetota bacterium]